MALPYRGAAMTTTLQINLSQQMQDWLDDGGSGNGVSAYAILFGTGSVDAVASTPLGWASLVKDGVVQSGGTVTLDLTTDTQPNLYGGKVYFIIQSLDGTAGAIDPTTLTQDAITWTNAAALNYRYDSIEVSLTGASGDAANLTSIEGFGIGMALSASTGSRGYAVPADTMFGALSDAATQTVSGSPPVTTFTAGALAGDNRMVVSPAVAVVADNDYPLYASADWTNYVDALKAPDSRIVLSGYFNGAADLQAGSTGPGVWRNAGFFSYALEWRAAEGTFWLAPTEGSQIQGAIKLTPDALTNSIYSTLGTVELYEAPGVGTPFELYTGSSVMSVGANNAWGQVLQQLTIGMTAGYLESKGHSANAAVTAPIDLNANMNWSPVYAYGTNTHSSLGSDVTVRWDPYAEQVFRHSNSYGTQYGDALTAAFAQGFPQLPTYADGQNVSAMTVTLFADGETPPADAYTPPIIYNYVAGSEAGGRYAPAVWHDLNPTNVTIDFNPGVSLAQSLVLRDDVDISFRILTGYVHDEPQWQSVKLGGDGASPWQNWTFANAGGTYSVSGSGAAGQTSQSLVLTGLPIAPSGTGWYQIVVAAPGFEKAFNLYTTSFTPAPTSDDPNPIPQFSNFATDPALFGIDGLATLTPGPLQTGGGLLTFSVGVTGPTPTIDLALMQPNTDSAFLAGLQAATVPVLGLLQGGDFVALAGQDNDVHGAGGDALDLSFTALSGRLAFGWTGLNSVTETPTWIETYTNLVQGKSIAVIDIARHGSAGHIAPLHAKADLAGGWHTPFAAQLGNGVYDVTMTAYAMRPRAPLQPDLDVPLTPESATLTVTVQLAELDLRSADAGQALELLADGNGTDGNWIQFAASAQTLPQGVAIALYATDAAGTPVGPEGLPVAGIGQAVLGWVGSVGTDAGTILVDGTQAIYLPVGQHLRFGMADDSGVVVDAGAVAMQENGGGRFTLGLGDIALDAAVGNTLSGAMQAASVQRIYGQPLLHLEQGAVVEVAASGSTANRNTLGFVRLDIDPASGQASIDGVASGDAGFLDAVRSALDTGYRVTAGAADFAETAFWTVSGGTGYYAPVLITQSGEVFVFGQERDDGNTHIRTYGANTFGFEDLTAAQGSDFDYNDMIMVLRPLADPMGA